eukprot:TRINITY_DN2328_c0_g1::TRINITY_DN2328_c0_g1_i1::g.20795::m.20795 TRINITY_DN2328_c0_g1::TRINITY_DN2328_c0_g1_i1::g.20795  ORF type:complete len:719 (-),score=109.99,sp/Q55563/Y163_SYNY3/31.34/1e-33,sp/Q55563/Y163_SYNY3/30.72/5e-23,sp/Q55563/Y163_SYNY3/27.59/1e-22,sp/Q55563/Y163_SYNY3/27.69/2e-22,sp/Q55563/Y163_SYNY3/33.64/2e-17,sp/Q55563/Y163_SYNY3/44.33/4e-12,sp/Q55563/Y163_SYNY3/48.28/3e-07,WD40/PF00400.27/0.0027,WD40/PF00400.27/4.1e-11,WD40/PF00400.27/0.00016,WD40/PF00400.27/0.76,WD40/PF00400.2
MVSIKEPAQSASAPSSSNATAPSSAPMTWSVEQVAEWFHQLGLDQCLESVRMSSVTGQKLLLVKPEVFVRAFRLNDVEAVSFTEGVRQLHEAMNPASSIPSSSSASTGTGPTAASNSRSNLQACDRCTMMCTLFCTECVKRFCEACNSDFHSKGARKMHVTKALQMCQDCEKVLATLSCSPCQLLYCNACSDFAHSDNKHEVVKLDQPGVASDEFLASSNKNEGASDLAEQAAGTGESASGNKKKKKKKKKDVSAAGDAGSTNQDILPSPSASSAPGPSHMPVPVAPIVGGAAAEHVQVQDAGFRKGFLDSSASSSAAREVPRPGPATAPATAPPAVAIPAQSNRGKYLVTTSHDGTARVWDMGTHSCVGVLRGHQGPVYFASFSPDGKQIVTGSNDRTARIWAATQGYKCEAIWRGHAAWVISAAWTPAGRFLVTGGACDRLPRFGPRIGTSYTCLPVRGGHPSLRPRGGSGLGGKNAAPFSQPADQGKYIVTGSDTDSTARLWLNPDFQTPPQQLNPAGNGGNNYADSVAVLRGHKGQLLDVRFSPDGKFIIGSSQDMSVVWSRESANFPCVAFLDGGLGKYSPDGKLIVTFCAAPGADTAVKMWSAATHKCVGQLSLEDEDDVPFLFSAEFSPDSKYIVTAHLHEARVWSAPGLKAVGQLKLANSTVENAIFSPDGKYIVTSGEHSVQVWDAVKRSWVASLKGHAQDICTLSFSP